MNKLKKLFSPSALAATAATAMLISSAVTALAGDDISASTVNGNPGCNPPPTCSGIFNPGNMLKYWCCPYSPLYCTSDVTSSGGSNPTYYGWCSLTP